jgi:MFS family permease
VTAYAAFSSRNFRCLLAGTTLSNFGQQMLATVAAWDLYLATRSPVVLGNVGLAQIFPVLLFTFAAGHVADRYDRRRTVLISQALLAVTGFGLASAGAWRGVTVIYTGLFLSAVARAFQWPVTSALMPQTVPAGHLTNAISWSGTAREAATVGGPALAGVMLAVFGSASVYLTQAVCSVLAIASFAAMRPPSVERMEATEEGWKAVAEGLRFVWREKVILSAMSLDLLAVFFGGATALLPIFAEDILRVGATGLGWLRAGPAIGAAATSLYLAYHSQIRHAGLVLLASVSAFGLATIGFGLATSAWPSFLMLLLTGAFDAVSVVLRLTIVQTRTPDALRGRVMAVNGLFIASSNQWGAVESGLAAAWLGTVPSVVWGGVATIAVVILIGARSPSLRRWRQ